MITFVSVLGFLCIYLRYTVCTFIIHKSFIMDNRMYLSVDMMTALIFWIIRFDTPHKALTCVCDALSLQKVK